MTSGEFGRIWIESINPNREERQRSVVEDIPELAEDIKQRGLLQPITVTRWLDGTGRHHLVMGERRLEACRSIGSMQIDVKYTDEDDPDLLLGMEIAENIKRKDFNWRDEYRAVYNYYVRRRAKDPSFTQEQCGKELCIDQRSVSDRLKVVRGWLDGDQEIIDASQPSIAINILGRRNRRANEEMQEELQRILFPEEPVAPDPILNLDFNKWAATYDGPKFNFIHCDFPYGINADKHNQGGAKTHGGYRDTFETHRTLCESLCDNLDRLCLTKCHFMFWFSMHNYHWTLKFFEGRGIEFDPFPLVWMKSDNSGIIPNPDQGPRRIYETAFFGSRGGLPIVRATNNAIGEAAETDKRDHMSTKPVPVLQHFFKMFVDSSTLMLDPTAGSGNALKAAKSLGASYVLGLEENKEFCEDANRALRKEA
jgi:ParB/RepB/Spo0J family partition protein